MTTLLLHSSGFSGRQWGRLVAVLPGSCIAPDFAGYPRGIPWSEGPAWEIDVAEMLRVVDGLEGPIDLVGHSYGGAVALQVAVQRPGRIRRMVLHDPVVWSFLDEDGLESVDESFARFTEAGMLDEEFGGSREWLELFIDYWNGPGAWAALSDMHQTGLLHVGRKIFREVWDLFTIRTPSSEYDGVGIPMRITQGEFSPVEAQRVGRVLAERHPRRERVFLPCGHMAPVTHSDHFNAVTLDFLRSES